MFFMGKSEMEGVSLSLLPPASSFDCEHAQEEKDQSSGVMTDIFLTLKTPVCLPVSSSDSQSDEEPTETPYLMLHTLSRSDRATDFNCVTQTDTFYRRGGARSHNSCTNNRKKELWVNYFGLWARCLEDASKKKNMQSTAESLPGWPGNSRLSGELRRLENAV